MEKFSQFRDKGTGIQPFLPPKPEGGASTAGLVLTWTLGSVLAVVRLAGLTVVGLWYLVLSTLVTVARGVLPGILVSPLSSYATTLATRMALFIVGAMSIGSKWTAFGKRTARERQSLIANAGWPVGGSPAHGSLIVANSCSWLDVLYLGFRFNPTFTRVPTEGCERRADVPVGQVVVHSSLWAALGAALWQSEEVGSHSAQRLATVLEWAKKNRRGPVVVFPEGTQSNNRGVLDFLPVLEEVPAGTKVTLVGLKYGLPTPMSPTPAVWTGTGSPWAHVWKVLSQPSVSMRAVYLVKEDVPSVPEAGAAVSAASEGGDGGSVAGTAADWSRSLNELLAKMLETRRCSSSGAIEKRAFFAFFDARNAGASRSGRKKTQ